MNSRLIAVTAWFTAITMIMTGGILGGVIALGIQVEAETNPALLPPCATEDSDNCYWDANRGNGTGTSFVVINGELYYLED